MSGEAKRFRALYGSSGRHGDSFWKEEEGNVGMKLLKGMGWSDGQGLGKQGQGKITLVKQFRKKDNAGIGGASGTRDEAFRASQDLFNDVLARLNANGDIGATSGCIGSAATSVDGHLAKRQMSRRFVRGKSGGTGVAMKDTANYGADAMAEIFGRRKDTLEQSKAVDVDEAVEAPPEQTTSSLSLSDYFALKRAQMGLSSGGFAPSAAPATASSGFTLDDQANFAEEQLASAYFGRGGLGSGGGGGKQGAAPSIEFAPQQLQPSESQARLLYGGKDVDAAKADKPAKTATAAPPSPRQSPRLAAAVATAAPPLASLDCDIATAASKEERRKAKRARRKQAKAEALTAKVKALAPGPQAVQAAEQEGDGAKAAKKAAKKEKKEKAKKEKKKRKRDEGDKKEMKKKRGKHED